MKRFNTITGIVDTGLITSTVITGGVSTEAFGSGVGLLFGIALSGTSFPCNRHHTKIFLNLHRKARTTRCY